MTPGSCRQGLLSLAWAALAPCHRHEALGQRGLSLGRSWSHSEHRILATTLHQVFGASAKNQEPLHADGFFLLVDLKSIN